MASGRRPLPFPADDRIPRGEAPGRRLGMQGRRLRHAVRTSEASRAARIPRSLYQAHLGRIISDSRQAAGWDAPWFVAQVSYHVPGDEASADIREAQAALWKTGPALQGPDSDALKGDLRERGGKGVHFSGIGLRAHAASWAEKITPWLERELGQK